MPLAKPAHSHASYVVTVPGAPGQFLLRLVYNGTEHGPHKRKGCVYAVCCGIENTCSKPLVLIVLMKFNLGGKVTEATYYNYISFNQRLNKDRH